MKLSRTENSVYDANYYNFNKWNYNIFILTYKLDTAVGITVSNFKILK